jgi:hypothetical protein
MRPNALWLVLAAAAVFAGCSKDRGGDSGGGAAVPATGVEAVSAVVASSSETTEPVNTDSMSLTSSETAEPFAI